MMDFTLSISDTSPFTLDNIPFGVISTQQDPSPRCATAVGEYSIDLRALCQRGFFTDGRVSDALSQVSSISSYSLEAYDLCIIARPP